MHVRIAWITILAKKHYRTHRIRMNAPLLAKWANIDEAQAAEAMAVFLAPDPRSLNPLEEGRRIKLVAPNDYLVINGEFYAKEMAKFEDREKAKARMQALRAAERVLEHETETNPDASLPVEYPPGFPATEDDAVKACSVHCPEIPEAELRRFWLEAAGRGGRDMFDQPIRSWTKHAKGRWKHPGREAAAKPKTRTDPMWTGKTLKDYE